jgi:hypothetical protein
MLPELEAMKSLLLLEWDPIGVSDCVGAEDEYDSYATQVFTMLASGADTAAIGNYLSWVVTSRMSLIDNPEVTRAIAAKAVAIHARFLKTRPSREEVEAAARILREVGNHHGWWKPYDKSYDDMAATDPIAKPEFDGLVEQMLMAAHKARS